MAYIIQQRRDTLENWNRVNPVLADAEIGFILDKDDNGVQKSSLFKIGPGKWNDLPLFGFSGNVLGAMDAWKGSDLDITVPSQQAVLNKIRELIGISEGNTNATIELIQNDVEWLQANKANQSDVDLKLNADLLVNRLALEEGEDDKMTSEVVSRKVLVDKFDEVDATLVTTDLKIDSSVQELKEETDQNFTNLDNKVELKYQELRADVDINKGVVNKHEKDIYTWTEEVDTEDTDPETGEIIKETITHKGFDDKIKDVSDKVDTVESKFDSMHQVMSERDYASIKDFTPYSEGALFFTYKDE